MGGVNVVSTKAKPRSQPCSHIDQLGSATSVIVTCELSSGVQLLCSDAEADAEAIFNLEISCRVHAREFKHSFCYYINEGARKPRRPPTVVYAQCMIINNISKLNASVFFPLNQVQSFFLFRRIIHAT